MGGTKICPGEVRWFHSMLSLDGRRYRRYVDNVEMVLNFPVVREGQITPPDFREELYVSGGISLNGVIKRY